MESIKITIPSANQEKEQNYWNEAIKEVTEALTTGLKLGNDLTQAIISCSPKYWVYRLISKVVDMRAQDATSANPGAVENDDDTNRDGSE